MATGNTLNYSLPYPLSTDPVNVASDIQELSDALDTFLTSPAFINNLAINAGSLVTSSATAALFNTGATTLNIGGAATTINVGATTGQVNVRGNFNIATGKVYEINDVTVLSATTLGSSVVSSSLTAVGTLTTGVWNAGNILLPLGASSSPSLVFTGDTNTGMWSPAADTVAFSTGGSERLRITSAGNVGIGTTTPTSNLYINTDTQVSLANGTIGTRADGTLSLLMLSGGTQGDGQIGPGLTFGRINSGRRGAMIASVQTSSDADQTGLLFAVRAAAPTADDALLEAMRITHAGNVGIGTSSPERKLHIGNGSDSASILQHGTGNFVGISIRNIQSTASANSTSYIDTQNENSIADGHLFFVHETDGSSIFLVGTTPAGSKSSDRRVERMRITGAGNVGIGVTNPGHTLDITGGTSQYPTALRIRSTTHATSRRAGILFGDTANVQWLVGSDRAGNGGNDWFVYDGVNAAVRFYIDSAGNINIPGGQIIMESLTTGAPTDNVSFKVERGTSPDVEIRWNETGDAWQFTNNGTTYFDIPTSAGSGAGLQDILMFAGM